MKFSEISNAAVLVVLSLVLLSIVFAAVIGVATLVLRNNKLVMNMVVIPSDMSAMHYIKTIAKMSQLL